MKVVLISPRFESWANNVPLGIAYPAAVLQEAGHDASAIDASEKGLDAEQVANEVKKLSPDFAGATATTPNIEEAWRILEQIKAKAPEISTVLGGVHPTVLPDESMEKDYVDFVIRGEGELTLLELMGGKSFDEIKGLSYKEDGKIIHNQKRPPIENLDELPFPARELFKFPEESSSPLMEGKKYATILTSRGCIGKCNFCNKSIFGSKFHARSPENVIAEIEMLVEKYQIDEFHITDDAFTTDPERVEKICDLLIKKDIDLPWACPNGIRVDSVDLGLLRKMKEAGCYRLAFGVESGSQEVLDGIGKDITLAQIREAFAMAREAGIATHAFIMLGNYGETKETMEETIEFVKTLDTDYAQFSIVVPLPGTPLYRHIEKEGRFTATCWSDFASHEMPAFETDKLSAELMLDMQKKAYREFYKKILGKGFLE